MASSTTSWGDLSDDELAERLIQRGMPPEVARDWTYYRDTEGAAQLITGMLEER